MCSARSSEGGPRAVRLNVQQRCAFSRRVGKPDGFPNDSVETDKRSVLGTVGNFPRAERGNLARTKIPPMGDGGSGAIFERMVFFPRGRVCAEREYRLGNPRFDRGF